MRDLYDKLVRNKKFLSALGGVFLVILVLVCFLSYKHYAVVKTTISLPPSAEKPVAVATSQNIAQEPSKPKTEEVKPAPLLVGTDRFVVALKDTNDMIAANLLAGGYISDAGSFNTLLSGKDGKGTVAPGGYKISNEMTNTELVQVLKGKPYMKWVVIPEGLRKEEIASLLQSTLGWSAKQKNTWLTVDTVTKSEYIEGVYFPDTYLIPTDESTSAVANRLISKFNEKFAPYLPQFTAQNIKWTTALTLASIVQREAANDADAPLIAGILWNRLNQGMPLDVDATLQYARGNTGSGWWAPITVAEKQTDSPFNTYIHVGLPPHPICNPGLPAIDAVLNPATTDCLYYLHDKNHVTHCAATYEEHLANIEEYLKSN